MVNELGTEIADGSELIRVICDPLGNAMALSVTVSVPAAPPTHSDGLADIALGTSGITVSVAGLLAPFQDPVIVTSTEVVVSIEPIPNA